MRCSARQGCATDWRWGDEISMSGAEASLQDPNQGAFGIRGTFQPGRAEVYGGSGVNVQFPGQGESDPDSRKEAGTGYWDGTVPWGYCSGSSIFKRWYCDCFGKERRIEQGSKNRNPDGTVNYCTLEVV